MIDEKKYTEREKVLAERRAFVLGRTSTHVFDDLTDARREAAARYPLPKVTRRRVVADVHNPRITWSVDISEIVGYDCEHVISHAHSAFIPFARRIELWADLLANPTEEVDG